MTNSIRSSAGSARAAAEFGAAICGDMARTVGRAGGPKPQFARKIRWQPIGARRRRRQSVGVARPLCRIPPAPRRRSRRASIKLAGRGLKGCPRAFALSPTRWRDPRGIARRSLRREQRPSRWRGVPRAIRWRPASVPLHRRSRGRRRISGLKGFYAAADASDGGRPRHETRLGCRRSLQHRPSALAYRPAWQGRARERI